LTIQLDFRVLYFDQEKVLIAVLFGFNAAIRALSFLNRMNRFAAVLRFNRGSRWAVAPRSQSRGRFGGRPRFCLKISRQNLYFRHNRALRQLSYSQNRLGYVLRL